MANVPNLSQHCVPALLGLSQHRDGLVLVPVGHRGRISYVACCVLLLVISLLSFVCLDDEEPYYTLRGVGDYGLIAIR
jgi:hypothetical protein